MPEIIRALLAELKVGLKKVYGKRLKEVYVFGSYARGEQDSESDLDVMIVLKGLDQYQTELERTGELVSTLSLKNGITISRVFISERDWLEGDTPLLRNVRVESVAA